MKLSCIGYRVVCPSEQLLLRELKAGGVNVTGIVCRDGALYFSVSAYQRRQTERILERQQAQFTVTGQGAAVRALAAAGKRPGLWAGAVIFAAALIMVQNYVVNIEVLSDDPEIRQRVTEVLCDCGVESWTYIPSIERAKTERKLRQTVDGISWAGITLADCTVIVDVLEDIPQPKRTDDHCPTNLVAKHDAVIDKLEILNGTAVKTVGSGVVAGEVLVSGIVPVEHSTRDKDGRPVTETTEKYVRSIGAVYGRFSVSESFTQPLTETELVYSPKTENKYSIQLFSTEIPLYAPLPAGMVSRSDKTSFPDLWGVKVPVGIVKHSCTPYSFRTVMYTAEQAEAQARADKERYERNFLDSYEMLGQQERVTVNADSVTLTVTYDLYGDVCEERAFYIPEMMNDHTDEKKPAEEAENE